jgi:hypothetical protein
MSVDAHRGHESCAGKVTIPHAVHFAPISCGSAAGKVLVHPDRDAEPVLAEADRLRGQRQRARGGRAPDVDVGERDAGEAEERDHGVGVVDLVAAGEAELDLSPLDTGVGQRAPDRDRAHLDPGGVAEPPERVQPHPDDRHVTVHPAPLPPSNRRG